MTTPYVETNYVVEISTESQIEIEHDVELVLPFILITYPQFVAQFIKKFPQKTKKDAQNFWNILLGHGSLPKSENPNAPFFTKDAMQVILENSVLFASGIDFENLPKGFFFTTHPQTHCCNVLHYNEVLGQHHPLAMVLSEKGQILFEEEIDTHFEGEKAAWYQFLCSKMSDDDGSLFCTTRELFNAFVTFSNTLSRLDLQFYPFDFSQCSHYKTAFNPVVLLGRWHTALTQPHLNPKDVSTQWEVLPQLDMTKAYGALRALSDYEHTERPCSFLHPAMFVPNETGDISYHYIQEDPEIVRRSFYFNGMFVKDQLKWMQEIDSFTEIHHFWRCIAYETRRNSVTFYHEALKLLAQRFPNRAINYRLRTLLIGCSTGSFYAENREDEELVAWEESCEIMLETLNISTSSLLFKSEKFQYVFLIDEDPFSQPEVEERQIAHKILAHYNLTPIQGTFIILCCSFHRNSPVLYAPYMLNWIKDFCQISLNGDVTGVFKLKRLLGISEALEDPYFWKGARFYIEDKFKKVSLKDYTKCISASLSLHQSHHFEWHFEWIASFSAFNIHNIKHLKKISAHIRAGYDRNLNFKQMQHDKNRFLLCLSYFDDVTKQQSVDTFLKLMSDVLFDGAAFDSDLALLNYLEAHFARDFPKDYFQRKKSAWIDAKNGLNLKQIKRVQSLKLPEKSIEGIIEIESALIRNNCHKTFLNDLNQQFLSLNRRHAPHVFIQFIEKLASIKEILESKSLSEWLKLALSPQNLFLFDKMYYQYLFEKKENPNLIDQILFFVKKLNPLAQVCVQEDISERKLSLQTILELMTVFLLNSGDKYLQDDFIPFIRNVIQCIQIIHREMPSTIEHLLNVLRYLPKNEQYLGNVYQFLEMIDRLFPLIKNEKLCYALLAHYEKSPEQLYQIVEALFNLKSSEHKAFLSCLIVPFMTECEINDIDALVSLLNENPEQFNRLKTFLEAPPYPELKMVLQWLQDDEEDAYEAYDKTPFGERRFDFAFSLQQFKAQKHQFYGTPIALFKQDTGFVLNTYLEVARSLSSSQLNEQFQLLRDKASCDAHDQQKLLCTCIEMLARTASQWDDGTPPKRISQECNTTQVMALYAMLMHPGKKLMSEIDTGEGKTRINMILAACQVAMGKTVDVITSDFYLAERDFLEYRDFFTALGIETSLISLNTPKHLYAKKGVNFSDNRQLLLLRNYSDAHKDPFAYLDEDPASRSLQLDEVDKFIHDKAKDPYNYAQSSPSLREFVWIYPLLVNFVRSQLTENADIPFNADASVEPFMNYVIEHDINPMHGTAVSNLKEENRAQLITWLQSAHTALHLKKNQDYMVTEDTPEKLVCIRDADGYPRYTRQILVADNGRLAEKSTFSQGTQECLAVIENQKIGQEAFIVLPENQTLYTRYPVAFLNQYSEGHIFGCSGTTRYLAPTTHAEINYEDYHYITVPRERPLIRTDHPAWIAKDAEQHIRFLKKDIASKLAHQPVLLICKNDAESQRTYEALMADPEFEALCEESRRIHALSDSDEEQEAIATAGTPGTLTISTVGMSGRGVDILAENLYVVSSYIPTFEDLKQIQGRTARNGKQGEFRMIVNKEDNDTPLRSTYHIDKTIYSLQNQKALRQIKEEEMGNLYGHFLDYMHRSFAQSEISLENWALFLDTVNKDWGIQKIQLLAAIENQAYESFECQFHVFASLVASRAIEAGVNLVGPWDIETVEKVSNALKTYQTQWVSRPSSIPLRKGHRYDSANDGQACIYTSLFADTRATLHGKRKLFANTRACLEGRGVLFADLRALLSGDRPLFASLRATIAHKMSSHTPPAA